MVPIDLKEEEEKMKPKPNALTNWLVQGGKKAFSDADSGKEEKKPEKKSGMMSSWLAKGKRKSDAVGGDDDDETKKLKNDN